MRMKKVDENPQIIYAWFGELTRYFQSIVSVNRKCYCLHQNFISNDEVVKVDSDKQLL